MIEFTTSPTEQTTAVTDLLLAAFAFASGTLLRGYRPADPWKVNLWGRVFALLGVAAAAGAIVHGVVLEAPAKRGLWWLINLSLGLTIALFLVAAVTDRLGEKAARRAGPLLMALAVGFFAVTAVFPGVFLVFLLYEAVAMTAALVIYSDLAIRNRLPGAWWMVVGVLLSLAAAVLQASKHAPVTLVWQFDHNGTFHILQAVALLALFAGLRAALAGRRA